MTQLEFTPEELTAIRAEYCKGASDTQFDLFISECKARNLRPGVHLVWQSRKAKEYDSTVGAWVFVQKGFWITTIAALRLIAQRTGDYLGQGPEEYVYLDKDGNPTIKSEIPLPHEDPTLRPLPREPWVARATVYRKGFSQPMIGMARFEAYASTQKTDNGPVLTETWRKRGCEQLFKCAEALAFRKAYPEEMAGLLLSEELKDEVEVEKTQAVTPASVVPLPPVIPKVDQTPAQPTDAPRPNETKVEYHVTGVPATLPAHSGSVLVVKPETLQPEPAAIEAAKKAVPDLKPASELPTPKKRGPKAKSPDNGRDVASEGGITQADIDAPPQASTDTPENKAEAEAFVESLDPTPTKEEMSGFTARVRALTSAGALSADLKNYILNYGKKSDTKQLTIADWSGALTDLEAAQAAGTLKEVTKNAPLPAF